MEILSLGASNKPIIIFIHGFASPYQIWNPYIDFFNSRYRIVVPILPGHNVNKKDEFTSFDDAVNDFLNQFIPMYGNDVFAIYGMSMGGVFAASLWQSGKLNINKIIFESSPLHGFNSLMANILTSQYISINKKARKRNPKIIENATKSMVTKDKLPIFLNLVDNFTDDTVRAYLKAIASFSLKKDIDVSATEIYYFYGGKANESIFKKAGKYLKKIYPNTVLRCNEGKGHCETSLLHPELWIPTIDLIL